MPKRKAAVKRLRVDKKRHARNLIVKKELKKTLKKLQALVTAKKIAEARELLKTAFSHLDKAAKKNIIHPKTADRKKSRLALRLAKIA